MCDLELIPVACVSCGDGVSPRRTALGYLTCIGCGSPVRQFHIMEVPKSNSIVTSRVENTRGIASSHKSARVDWNKA